MRRKTTKEIISEFRSKHGNLYDYSKVNYINGDTKVCIIHPEYGEHWITPKHHKEGCGHPLAGRDKTNIAISKRKTSIDKFIEKSISVHGNLYDYSKVNYIDANIPVCIIDPLYGEFWITPSHHYAGNGHTDRSKTGYKSSKEGYFYITQFNINNKIYYKFGITNNIKDRLSRLTKTKNTLHKLYYSRDGKLIYNIEYYIKYYSNIKCGVVNKEQFKQRGFTETFEQKDLQKVLDIIEQYKSMHKCGSHIEEIKV